MRTSDSFEPHQINKIADELTNSALYAATIEPMHGAAQIVDHLATTQLDQKVTDLSRGFGIEAPKSAPQGSATWYAQQFGGALGTIVPFMLVHSRVQHAAGSSFGNIFDKAALASEQGHNAQRAGLNAAVLGSSGFIYGSILKPSDPAHSSEGNFYQGRFLSGTTDALMFGAMGLSHPLMESGFVSARKFVDSSSLPQMLKQPAVRALDSSVLPGIMSGMPIGAASAELSAWKDGRTASAEEIKSNAILMGTLGGAFSWLAPASSFKAAPKNESAVSPESNRTLAGGDVKGSSGESSFSVSPPAAQGALQAESALQSDRTIHSERATPSERPARPDLFSDSQAKLTWLFGDKGSDWIDYASPYIGVENSLKVLPKPTPGGNEGLARYFVNQVQNISESQEIFQLREIGKNWSQVDKADRVMPINDLFFKMKTGMTLSDYMANPEKAVSFTPRDADHPNLSVMEASIGNAKVGSVVFHLEPPFLHIDNLKVEEGFKRLGLGTQIIGKLEQSSDPRITKVSLEVANNNTPARKLYRKLGFEFVNSTTDEWSMLAKPIDRQLTSTPASKADSDLFELLQNGLLKVTRDYTKKETIKQDSDTSSSDPILNSAGGESRPVLGGFTEDDFGRVRHVYIREHRPLEAKAAQFHTITNFDTIFPQTATRPVDNVNPQVLSYFPWETKQIDVQERIGKSIKERTEDGTLKRLNIDLLHSDLLQDAIAERAIIGDMDAHLGNFSVTKQHGKVSIGTLDIEANDGAFGSNTIPIIRSPLPDNAIAPSTLSKINQLVGKLETREGMNQLRDIGLNHRQSEALLRRTQFLSQYKRFPGSIAEVTQDPNLPSTLIEWLANDPDAMVRESLARNLRSNPDVLARLATDENTWVRSAALENLAQSARS